MFELIMREYREMNGLQTSKELSKIAHKLYSKLPVDDDKFIELCNQLVRTNEWIPFQLMTIWIKQRNTMYRIKYFQYYKDWLIENVSSWGACDQYCYRVLNPMVERFPETFIDIKDWSKSDKLYVKRASAVCMLQSTQTFTVNLSFEKVRIIADELIGDTNLHVQKGVGWLLKYTYLTYPKKTIEYLKMNVKNMSRITYRYSLQKMPVQLKRELLKNK